MSTSYGIDELLAEGRHGAAAEAARATGDPARAAKIYAQIWDWKHAAACALEAGDTLAAIGYLCDARDPLEATRLARELPAEQQRAGAEILAGKRLLEPAAQLFERLGEDARAAELYQKAGQPLPAALLLEKLGRLHDAGRLLERAVADDSGAEAAAPAHLALGRILARLGQHEAAAQHLQRAVRHAPTRAEAARRLVAELAALGLPAAAADALDAARRDDPTLPLTVAELVETAPAPGEPNVVLIGGRYRAERLLGGSPAGRVFLARDEVSGAEVAVKVFTAPAAPGQPAYERFLREAQVQRRAEHPHIVRILDFREDLGYLAMEYMTGGTLEARLATGKPLAATAVRRFALDVLAALAHAHDRGVVHRDIKPANIFFDGRGGAKLGDFGVAHLADLGQTQTGALIGTLAYMSPEQITGAPVDATTDLYALGVTLFQALTGRLPFLGPDFIAQHLGDAPPRVSDVTPAAAAWDELVGLLLCKDPAARPRGAVETAEEVRLIAGDGPRRVLSLPRGLPAVVAEGEPAAPAAVEDGARYVAEVPLGATATSTLARAVDRVLERTVVIERFAPGHPDAAAEARLLRLAAVTTPFVQRVLGYDRAAGVAIYEAPVGAPPSAATTDVARFTEELGRALAAIHELGGVHGALAEMVLDDAEAGVTVLAAGLGAVPEGASVEGDLADAKALARKIHALLK